MEGYGPHSYGEGFADVYDEWYLDAVDLPGCVRAVAAVAQEVPDHASPPVVLELGIGTGRLALPLADAGLDVRGIDASPAMVDALRAKPGGDLPVVLDDFARVRVPRRAAEAAAPPADVVLCADNTLFNLADEPAQRACLAGVAAVLRPGGALVVEAFVPPPDDEVRPGGDDEVRVRRLSADRVVLTASVRDRDHQTMEGQFIDIGAHGVRLRPWALHYLFPDQLDALAAEAGLVLHHRWADWAGSPFDELAARHVSTYRASPPSSGAPG